MQKFSNFEYFQQHQVFYTNFPTSICTGKNFYIRKLGEDITVVEKNCKFENWCQNFQVEKLVQKISFSEKIRNRKISI